MIALVGDHDAGRILARRQPDRVEIARGGVQRRRKGRRIALVGGMNRRRRDDAGVKIDLALRLNRPDAWFRPLSWRSCVRVGASSSNQISTGVVSGTPSR
jgi:hypothetical protein